MRGQGTGMEIGLSWGWAFTCLQYLVQELWGKWPAIHQGCLLDKLFGLLYPSVGQEPPWGLWQNPVNHTWL